MRSLRIYTLHSIDHGNLKSLGDTMTRIRLKGAAALFCALVAVWTPIAEAHTRITTDVTWGSHIRDILRAKCMVCHHPGGLAPDYADFTFYGTAVDPGAWAWRAAIEEEIITGRMPPWKPDSRFGEFANARLLTQEEKDLIIVWSRGGGPQGPVRNLPVPEEFLVIKGSPRDPHAGVPSTVFRYDLVYEFVSAIVEERDAVPGFDHGARAQAVADAVLESYEKKTWVQIDADLD